MWEAHLVEGDLNTVLAYAECDMKPSSAAEKCFVHVNTLKYRLEKVHRFTGLDPRHFYDLVKLVDLIKNDKDNLLASAQVGH